MEYYALSLQQIRIPSFNFPESRSTHCMQISCCRPVISSDQWRDYAQLYVYGLQKAGLWNLMRLWNYEIHQKLQDKPWHILFGSLFIWDISSLKSTLIIICGILWKYKFKELRGFEKSFSVYKISSVWRLPPSSSSLWFTVAQLAASTSAKSWRIVKLFFQNINWEEIERKPKANESFTL